MLDIIQNNRTISYILFVFVRSFRICDDEFQ